MQISRFREIVGEYKMRPLTISLPDYLYEKLTQQAKSFETSLEELVLFQLKRDEAKDAALALLRKRAGRCLAIREPFFKKTARSVWIFPIYTNVAPPMEVGEILVDADSGEVLSTEIDVSEMLKKGHTSFGFESLAAEKQKRLAELLALNNQRILEQKEKNEMEALLAEDQTLQIRNLETLEKRLLL